MTADLKDLGKDVAKTFLDVNVSFAKGLLKQMLVDAMNGAITTAIAESKKKPAKKGDDKEEKKEDDKKDDAAAAGGEEEEDDYAGYGDDGDDGGDDAEAGGDDDGDDDDDDDDESSSSSSNQDNEQGGDDEDDNNNSSKDEKKAKKEKKVKKDLPEDKIFKLPPVFYAELVDFEKKVDVTQTEYVAYHFLSGAIDSEDSRINSFYRKYSQLRAWQTPFSEKYKKEIEKIEKAADDAAGDKKDDAAGDKKEEEKKDDAAAGGDDKEKEAGGDDKEAGGDDDDKKDEKKADSKKPVEFPGRRWIRSMDEASLTKRMAAMKGYMDFLAKKTKVVNTPEYTSYFKLQEDAAIAGRLSAFTHAINEVAIKKKIMVGDFDDELTGFVLLNYNALNKTVLPKLEKKALKGKPEMMVDSLRAAFRTAAGSAIQSATSAQYQAWNMGVTKMVEAFNKVTQNEQLVKVLNEVIGKIYSILSKLFKSAKKSKPVKHDRRSSMAAAHHETVKIVKKLQRFKWGNVIFVLLSTGKVSEKTMSVDGISSTLYDTVRLALRSISEHPNVLEKPLQRSLTILNSVSKLWFNTVSDMVGFIAALLRAKDTIGGAAPADKKEMGKKFHKVVNTELSKEIGKMVKKLDKRKDDMYADKEELGEGSALLYKFVETVDISHKTVLNIVGKIRNRWAYLVSKEVKKGGVDAGKLEKTLKKACVAPINEGFAQLMTIYVELSTESDDVPAEQDDEIVFNPAEYIEQILAKVRSVLTPIAELGIPGLENIDSMVEDIIRKNFLKVIDKINGFIKKHMPKNNTGINIELDEAVEIAATSGIEKRETALDKLNDAVNKAKDAANDAVGSAVDAASDAVGSASDAVADAGNVNISVTASI